MSLNDYWIAKMRATEGDEGFVESSKEDRDAEFEAEKAEATAVVPSDKSTKEQIRSYLTYEHGLDPQDLQDMTKADLLGLVTDLAE